MAEAVIAGHFAGDNLVVLDLVNLKILRSSKMLEDRSVFFIIGYSNLHLDNLLLSLCNSHIITLMRVMHTVEQFMRKTENRQAYCAKKAYSG